MSPVNAVTLAWVSYHFDFSQFLLVFLVIFDFWPSRGWRNQKKSKMKKEHKNRGKLKNQKRTVNTSVLRLFQHDIHWSMTLSTCSLTRLTTRPQTTSHFLTEWLCECCAYLWSAWEQILQGLHAVFSSSSEDVCSYQWANWIICPMAPRSQ